MESSSWGAPSLPGEATSPSREPNEPQGAASPGGRRIGGSFLLLIACAGVLALLAGLGLWAASYTSPDSAERVSAEGTANERGAPVEGQGADDQAQNGVNKVTVP
ncbi:hypothetical protein [Streptosporangium sp. NPDC051022]|uniref:hypothetical protein n=1 Tax=Streptosporangium sp. NPDC051022 TaxID=3155752 RepID=UPI00341D1C12